AAAHVEAAALREALGEGNERAGRAEVVERLRPQLARDAAHVLERGTRGLLRLEQLGPELWVGVASAAAELEQHRGERLPHLVMKLLGDPQPLALLRGEHAAGGVPALVLEAREHLVEGGGQLA